MSEEEAMNQLKTILKVRKEQKEIIECTGGYCGNCNPDIVAIETIIKLIEKQQKELDQEKEKNKELLYKLEVEKIDNKYNKEEAQEEMIPKYKIRAKIEKIKNICKKCRYKGEICKDLNNHNCCVPGLTLKTLKELLEE